MSHVTYKIVEHDGGWAYKVGDVLSETFPTSEAAQEPRAPRKSGRIEYEDSAERWREEDERGDDRPDTEVKDYAPNAAQRYSAARTPEN